MAVFAPIPSASVNAATAVNPRLLCNWRNPKRTSCISPVISSPSFVAERCDWLHSHRATGRQRGSCERNESYCQYNKDQRLRVAVRHSVQLVFDEATQSNRERYGRDHAAASNQEYFSQDQFHDRSPRCA